MQIFDYLPVNIKFRGEMDRFFLEKKAINIGCACSRRVRLKKAEKNCPKNKQILMKFTG